MISQRIIPAIPPRRRYLLAGGRYLLAGGLCLLGLVFWSARLPAEPINFGEGFVYGGCLHIVVESYLDRQGEVDNHDWVTLRVTNNCKIPIKHLRVALVLLDAGGAPYGTADWLLERGIYLPPGESRIKKVAVPDSDNRIAVRWEIKVLRVSKALGGARRRRRN
jgi:hypothetical protein